jgi:hypothetical protein
LIVVTGGRRDLILFSLLSFFVIAMSLLVTSSASASSVRVSPTQKIATLKITEQVFSAPSVVGTSYGPLQAKRPLTSEKTSVPVLAEITKGKTQWLKIRVPGRPNGRVGFIKAVGATLSSTPWHLVINRSLKTLSAYKAGILVKRTSVIVGKSSTPTPGGEFFVEEDVILSPNEVGAPYALALSARSNVFQEFDGGPGQIALHGLQNVGGTLGTASSHGCVRLDTKAITWMARHIAPGTPVSIR